jgi:hypothetical protein
VALYCLRYLVSHSHPEPLHLSPELFTGVLPLCLTMCKPILSFVQTCPLM